MRTEAWGGLRVHITGGADREGGGDGPAVVLLHGFGAPGDDLVPLWRVLDVPHEVRFVFPEAPLSLPELGPYGARAWWRLDLEAIARAQAEGRPRNRADEDPTELGALRGQLAELLDIVERQLAVPSGKLVLGGFSQGSMVACDLALESGRPLAGLVLLSSTLLARARWQGLMPARAPLPVFQSHGRQDPLLPLAAAQQLRSLLEDAGCPVEWVEFNGGHELPPIVLSGLGAFLRAHL